MEKHVRSSLSFSDDEDQLDIVHKKQRTQDEGQSNQQTFCSNDKTDSLVFFPDFEEATSNPLVDI